MKVWIAILTVLLSVGVTVSGEVEGAHPVKQQQMTEPLERKVILQRVYVDGEMSEEIYLEKILAMEDFWANYQDWQLIDQNEERIIFQRKENDISPLLKANGFFGVSGDGTLSIFNGRPQDSQIIQSFFQIDVKKLESYKQQELRKGIPILNKSRYEQMIEAYKPYSFPKIEK
ncbi:intercompartmental signaling factor BofC [Bacillus sp. V59.32b]|uniref:intercompartmental signaling factor BofC n=1 Tax=Bacillus sp. V59.32b TaxID=1758642 RepID=UPI000E3BA7E0|nr:intercompartmental signaling factor BofC [Bacillus sp. V59.32b]RFU62778.1 regulator [Bacillus sp. V59.32b]